MKIENDMHVSAPIEEAWALLTDIPAIAPCLPGAELTGHDGETYEGLMKIKVGPITAEYHGTATVLEMDEVARVVRLTAKGRDKRGTGNASAEIVATMTGDGEGTTVSISTDLKISGKVAQFGRGVMADISGKLLGQFADCIESKLVASTPDASDPAVEGDTASAPSTEPTSEPASLDVLDVAGGALLKRLAPVLGLLLVVWLVRRWRR